MAYEIRLLDAADVSVLDRVGTDVFDEHIDPALAREFLSDPRHHIIVAIEDGVVIGFVSGVDYVHPDKPREMWINEVGVGSAHRRRGIAREALAAMLAHARSLGCDEAWLGTEPDNVAARALYDALGGQAEEFIGYTFTLGAKP